MKLVYRNLLETTEPEKANRNNQDTTLAFTIALKRSRLRVNRKLIFMERVLTGYATLGGCLGPLSLPNGGD